MKNLRLLNVSIYRNFYQNRFINEYVKKLKSQNPGMTESWSFLWDIEELTSLKIKAVFNAYKDYGKEYFFMCSKLSITWE